MSKFERHKKKSIEYIFPHKHCKSCNQMIEEGYTYCSDCYKKLQEKKKRKWFKRKKKAENGNSS
ncbi:MAG: DUF2116 family Zn-ribbon domain-containing protein [Candidatus Hermodarchaeota archaeon]